MSVLPDPAPWPRGRQILAVLLLFLALAVFHTWPLASGLNTYSRHDNGDAMLNEWVVAWVAHQLPRNPLALFDANIFYPEPNTLAFSEHLFVQALMGAPLLWAGVPSLVVHNVLIILGLALTGWAMAVVMYRWTGDWWAAVLAGLLFAFNAHSLARLAHLQAMHMEFLPFAMLALDRLLAIPRVRYALALATAFCLQSLTSNYQLVYLTFGIVAAALARPREWLHWDRRRTFGLLVLAGGLSVAAMFPFLIHYLQAQRDQGLTRTLEQVAFYAASWRDYLTTGGRVHFETWSAQFWRGAGAPLFPGVVAILLTVVAISRRQLLKSPVVRMWLGLTVVGFVMSFGASLPGYGLLYQAVPLLQGIRASVRFGRLALAGIAAIAAFGLLYLRRTSMKSPRMRVAVSVAVLLLVTIEASRVPLGYSPHPAYRVPAVYRVLAREPNAVVAEFPFYDARAWALNARYMLNSTEHWHPMLNGYSGFRPASYDRHYEALRSFPDAASMQALRSIGVTHVVVSEGPFIHDVGQEAFARLDETRGLRLMARSTGISIYRIEAATP